MVKLPFLRRLLTQKENESELKMSEKTKTFLLPNEPVSGSRETKNVSKDLVTGR